jgi:signal transduction histidine kinase
VTTLSAKAGWLPRLRHSLRLRLMVLFVVLALAMAAVFLGGMQRALSGGWRDVARPLVADYVDRLAAELGTPPDVARARSMVRALPLSIRIDGPAVQWDSHPHKRDRDWHRGDDEHVVGWWLLTRTTADGHRIAFGLGDTAWSRQPRAIGWVTLGVLLMLTALAYAYVRHLLRPLQAIGEGAQRYGQGEFEPPIQVGRRDELGDLANQVNAMASSLRDRLDAKRALLLAISHELRSPLTRARLNAELVEDSQGNRVPRDALLRDLAQMAELISDLLESERLANGHAGGHSVLQREPTSLNQLVAEVVARDFPGQPTQTLLTELPELPLDRTRMRLLLRNLIDNALRHNAEGGPPIVVSTEHDERGVRLRVRDFGPGVTEQQLPHLAEAFYRVDAARQRATGGVGLGLHLCRLVARAHGGELQIANAAPGLVVELLLPL